MIAYSETLGPLLQAAFPVAGMLLFAEELPHLISKIQEMSDAMAGFGKQAKKQFEEMVKASDALDFQGDVVSQDSRRWYAHGGSVCDRWPSGAANRFMRSMLRRGFTTYVYRLPNGAFPISWGS